MKINKLSIVGFIGGLAFTTLSSIRYYALYPDLDKALVYGIIGALIISVSYLYDKVKKSELKHEEKECDIQVLHERIAVLEPKDNVSIGTEGRKIETSGS